MNRQFIEEWLNKLKESWFDKDIETAVSLFESTTFYQETHLCFLIQLLKK